VGAGDRNEGKKEKEKKLLLKPINLINMFIT
jgi:hypothetical protein